MSEPTPAGEEEVLELGARRHRLPVAVLVVGCAALVAGGLLAALVIRSGSQPTADRPTVARSPSRIVLTFDAPRPVAGALPISGTRCPTEAHCSVWTRLPASAVAAVRAAFPGARISTEITEFAYQPGHYYADLLARHIVARAGARDVVVDVRTLADATGPITAALRVDQPGFAVSVQVADDQQDLSALHLARDDRLLAPE